MKQTREFEHHPLHVVPPGEYDEYPEGAWIQFTSVRTGLGGRRDLARASAVSREEPDEGGELVAHLRKANEFELGYFLEREGKSETNP